MAERAREAGNHHPVSLWKDKKRQMTKERNTLSRPTPSQKRKTDKGDGGKQMMGETGPTLDDGME